MGGDILIKLKAIRERCGMNQNELAQILGVSRSTVAMWETSEACPRGTTLTQLADVLNCSIDELFGRAPPGPAARDSA